MIRATDIPKRDELYLYSNPIKAQKKAFTYLGRNAILYKSQNINKKYAIIDPSGKIINFGQLGYQDYTKHNDKERRKNYLTRTSGMRGNWKDNPYSANNLSRNLLW
jgi:hypothetical protein